MELLRLRAPSPDANATTGKMRTATMTYYRAVSTRSATSGKSPSSNLRLSFEIGRSIPSRPHNRPVLRPVKVLEVENDGADLVVLGFHPDFAAQITAYPERPSRISSEASDTAPALG
jgi:hypothetical protein